MEIKELFYRSCEYGLYKPYIIAEAGVNHECRIELAKRLIEEAKEAGADAIKFQTYKAETLASKRSPPYWDTTKEATRSQYELFQKYDKFWKKEYEELKKYCDDVGIEFLSTPFDSESAKFLNDLVPAFKIASSDITNRPFIEYICGFNKPIILSTGASYLHEIEEAVDWVESYGNESAILHCVLNYPTKDENTNLGMILDLKRKFPDKVIGYSDHTLPGDMKNLEIAFLLGARIIEKHFTYDKSLPGNDHYHAMDKEDLERFCEIVRKDIKVIGSFRKKPLESEKVARQNARRSIVAKVDIQKGTVIANSHLTFKRPGTGIQPKYVDKIVGKRARRDIKEDEIIRWDFIEGINCSSSDPI